MDSGEVKPIMLANYRNKHIVKVVICFNFYNLSGNSFLDFPIFFYFYEKIDKMKNLILKLKADWSKASIAEKSFIIMAANELLSLAADHSQSTILKDFITFAEDEIHKLLVATTIA